MRTLFTPTEHVSTQLQVTIVMATVCWIAMEMEFVMVTRCQAVLKCRL
jgi:hypothetical protein